MTCVNCKEGEEKLPAVRSWTALPMIELEDMPKDLDLICGSDEKLQSWRLPLSYILERVDKLEKEVKKLKKELKDGK